MTTKIRQPCVLHENLNVKRIDFLMVPASPWLREIARKLMGMYGVTEKDLQDATQKDLESRRT